LLGTVLLAMLAPLAPLRRRCTSSPGRRSGYPAHTHPGVNANAVTARLGAVGGALRQPQNDDTGDFAAWLLAEMPPRPATYESVGATAGAGIRSVITRHGSRSAPRD
jgi:hypothetical protein